VSDIIPEGFSWSASRHDLFERCPRAYFFHYYLALGRVRDADRQRVAEAKRLRSMTNIWMWVGSRVHDAVEALLREAHRTGTKPDTAAAAKKMLERMRQDYRDSQAGPRPVPRGAKPPVRFHEHEYDADPGRPVWKQAADDAERMVLEFERLGYLDRLAQMPKEQLLEIEELNNWSFEGCPVWVKIDLAYRDDAGKIHVLDWKTGKRVREDDPIQLLGYATYVNDRWNATKDELSVREIYLRGGEEKACQLDEAKFSHAKDVILESIRGMLGALDDPQRNVALEDDFPTAPDTIKCDRCFFRRICPEMQESA
jgi:CRISPR/Cas system-associated exonuclease Cas4 (RecB family)